MATIQSTITLIDNVSSVLSNISTNIGNTRNDLQDLETSAGNAQREIDSINLGQWGQNVTEAGKQISGIGTQMVMGITAPLVAFGTKAWKTAADYEQAFTGVRKTTELTEAEASELYAGLIDLSTKTPTDFVALSGIAEIAGQLGVAKDELLDFVQTYDMLQVSTNIQGEEGAAAIAQFLNITEHGTQNIDRFGSAIVDLGNNFATTEKDILETATRLASTAELAGLSTPEILALSTAISSMGINAEAGGSAAGKLMKKMSLASEVGVDKWGTLLDGATRFFDGMKFSNIHDVQTVLDGLKSADVADFAKSMNMTKDELSNAMSMAQDMEYFTQLMGKSADQFRQDWSNNPAQSMLEFFDSLSRLDASGQQSALSYLNDMGITEIRLSNLVQALTSNPQLFSEAIAIAYESYAQNQALVDEATKFYETQNSQIEMKANEFNNAVADLGSNVQQAVQPAIDALGDLLAKWNSLSEADQDSIVSNFMIFAEAGVIVLAIGKTVEAIGNIATALHGVNAILRQIPGKFNGILDSITSLNSETILSGLTSVLSNPVTWGLVAGIGVYLLIDTINNIKSAAENTADALSNIKINIDQESLNTAISQIQQLRDEARTLSNMDLDLKYQSISDATKLGFGNQDMFNQSLFYESEIANRNISDIAQNYGSKLADLNRQIAAAASSGDMALAEQLHNQYGETYKQMEAETNAAKAQYSAQISALFNGMAQQYPEQAQQLTNAIQGYSFLKSLGDLDELPDRIQADNDRIAEAFSAGSITEQQFNTLTEANNIKLNDVTKKVYGLAYSLGYFGDEIKSLDELNNMIDTGTFAPAWNGYLRDTVMNNAITEIKEAGEGLQDNPILSNLLGQIFNDPSIYENLDVSQLDGALMGALQTLDIANAMNQALENDGSILEFGKYLTQGLGQGIVESTSEMEAPINTLRDDTLNFLKAAFIIGSPSQLFAEQGIYLIQGLAQGITENLMLMYEPIMLLKEAVLMYMAEAFQMAPSQIMAEQGMYIDMGLAQGITTFQTAVITAMNQMVQRMIEIMRQGALQTVQTAQSILSFSAGYDIGYNLCAGIAEGIRAGTAEAVAAARAMASAVNAAARVSFGVHSPSTVFYEIGEFIDEGLALGINAHGYSIRAIQKTADNAIKQYTDNLTKWSNIDYFAGVENREFSIHDDAEYSLSDADIKNMRELAEREVINEFTTAEVHVEFTANNNISSDLDIDEVVAELENRVSERLEMCAEGVYI